MLTFIQKNIWQEHAYDRFVRDLALFGEVRPLGVVPFTDGFMEGDQPDRPDYIFGSGRFVNICRAKGYPTFKSFQPVEPFGVASDWLNAGGKLVKWGELEITKPVFIKPVTEKFFTGTVVYCQADLGKVQLTSSKREAEEMVLVSDPINLQVEMRFFVINGKIITGSKYKNGTHTGIGRDTAYITGGNYRIDPLNPAWLAADRILGNGSNPYDLRHIDQAFVIDLGLTYDGWKIVELNNFNSAGLYECDTAAIARTLSCL